MAQAEFARHALKGNGQFDRIEILALNVFHDGELKNLLVVRIPNDHRNFGQIGQFGGAPAAFAGDDLKLVAADLPDDDRLDNAFALDGLS